MPTHDTEAFCAIARREVVNARVKLDLEDLSLRQEAELWQIIECIEALVKTRAQCFATELELIDRELEQRFRRT